MGKPESPKYDFSTRAAMFAAALVGGMMMGETINPDNKQDPIKTELTSVEIDSCRELAHDRAMEVCDRHIFCTGNVSDKNGRECDQGVFCNKYILENVEEKITADCEKGGVLPEPGATLDKCDLWGLRRATTSYWKAGHFTESFDAWRDAWYRKCLDASGITKQD